MGCASSTRTRSVAEPTHQESPTIGQNPQTRQEFHLTASVPLVSAISLSHEVDQQTTEQQLSSKQDAANELLEANLDESRSLTEAEPSTRRFTVTYLRALSVKAQRKDSAARTNQSAKKGRDRTKREEQASGFPLGDLESFLRKTSKDQSTRLGHACKQGNQAIFWINGAQHEAKKQNQELEPPTTKRDPDDSGSIIENLGSSHDPTITVPLEAWYSRRFKDKPPRWRLMLREARKNKGFDKVDEEDFFLSMRKDMGECTTPVYA
jgi:hypothetical protein